MLLLDASDGLARAGTIELAHGSVETPTFMPVGTRGSVRGLDQHDLEEVGAQMVLANTYHLALRPGSELIGEMGGLHRFIGWERPMLTDSGGFQVWSLDPRIEESGVTFKSSYDGSAIELTPESSMRIQRELGADVAMAFDELVGLPAPREVVRAAMERTLRWAERALAVHDRSDQVLFGIVQGGVDPELRAESARRTAELGFVGFGIGGLSVGESAEDRSRAISATLPELPESAIRYVMGLGDIEGVLEAVAQGCDIFDCVWPTRLARHGTVITSGGDYQIKTSEHTSSDEPLDPECPCMVCARYSRAYLRHLFRVKEHSVGRLISIHNLAYTISVLDRARAAIKQGTYAEFKSSVEAQRSSQR